MCASFFVACSAMIWAAVVQYYIYETNPCGRYVATCETPAGDRIVSSLNIWIQTGAYVLVGLSEIFGSITGLEYAYTKAPANMRSLVFGESSRGWPLSELHTNLTSGLYNFTSALSAAIGQAFVALAADPLLVGQHKWSE